MSTEALNLSGTCRNEQMKHEKTFNLQKGGMSSKETQTKLSRANGCNPHWSSGLTERGRAFLNQTKH